MWDEGDSDGEYRGDVFGRESLVRHCRGRWVSHPSREVFRDLLTACGGYVSVDPLETVYGEKEWHDRDAVGSEIVGVV